MSSDTRGLPEQIQARREAEQRAFEWVETPSIGLVILAGAAIAGIFMRYFL